MGIDFLAVYGARSMRHYDMQPILLGSGGIMDEIPADEEEKVDLNLELEAGSWQPIDVRHNAHATPAESRAWAQRPRRFIDGKDVGRTVAWLQSREGFPVPVRLSEIGAVAMREVEGAAGGELRREFCTVEKVVSLIVDLFPWDEVESFAAALQERGFRLLPAQPAREDYTFDFERMRVATQNRSLDEMVRLECRALMNEPEVPTLVDGRLKPRLRTFNVAVRPVVGVIKSHSQNYLHPQGWRTFYELAPGQRTPAFFLSDPHLDVISWYLRLDGARGEMPNWGIVRVEIAAAFVHAQLGAGWREYINRLSALLCDYRSRDESYGRSVVTIQPIQEAEHSLGSLFTETEALINLFYRMTSL